MGLLGLYLLNISVDTADPNPEFIPEDLSFNDQESIIEIIVEQVLGYKDAIKEYDDHDTQDHSGKKNVKMDVKVHQSFSIKNADPNLLRKNRHHFEYDARLPIGFTETDSPPPKG